MEKRGALTTLITSLALFVSSIIWGIISEKSLINFINNYSSWFISLGNLFKNDFYYGFLNKLEFLFSTGYYLLFAISLIIFIIVLITNISRINRISEKSPTEKTEPVKQENKLDRLIIECNEKIKTNKIDEAKEDYKQIQEISTKESYTKEQYDKIIELYKKIIAEN